MVMVGGKDWVPRAARGAPFVRRWRDGCGLEGGRVDQTWTLDAVGNWDSTTVNGVTQERNTNTANEIVSLEGADDTDDADIAYDAAGNMTTMPIVPMPGYAPGRLICRYDAWNRLTQVYEDDGTVAGELDLGEGGDTLLAEYQYDGLGRRIAKIVRTVNDTDMPIWQRTDFYYDEQWRVVEERVQGFPVVIPESLAWIRAHIGINARAQYIWGVGYVDTPICRFRDADGCYSSGDGVLEETLYYLADANHNVTALVRPDGTVVERYMYDAYGQVRVLNGDDAAGGDPDGADGAGMAEWTLDPDNSSDYGNEVMFSGYRYDGETGLYHVRHRYYHAILGAWTARDPAGFLDGANLHQYCGSNPAGATDPMGLERDMFPATAEYDRQLADNTDPSTPGLIDGPSFDGVKIAAGVGLAVGETAWGICRSPYTMWEQTYYSGKSTVVGIGAYCEAREAGKGVWDSFWAYHWAQQKSFPMTAEMNRQYDAWKARPEEISDFDAGFRAWANNAPFASAGPRAVTAFTGKSMQPENYWEDVVLFEQSKAIGHTGIYIGGTCFAARGMVRGGAPRGGFSKSVANRNLTKIEWKALARQQRIAARGGLPQSYADFCRFTQGRYTGAGHQAARGRAWTGFARQHGLPGPDPGTAGRLGGQATRAHVREVAAELESCGWRVTGGGGMFKEEYLPGLGGGRLGSNWLDITAVKNGRMLRINTIDVLADGITPTGREAAAAASIRAKALPGEHLLLVPKPK